MRLVLSGTILKKAISVPYIYIYATMVAALTHIDDLEWYNRTLYFDKKLIWMLRKVMERLFKSVREQQCLLKRCGFSGLL